jgi:hypothetical protein
MSREYKLNKGIKTFVINNLRRVFKKIPIYSKCMKRHKVYKARYNKDGSRSKRDEVFYECGVCRELFKQKDIHVDHISSVIPVDSSQDAISLDEFAARLFCSDKDLQILCKKDHTVKTNKENKLRKDFRDGVLTKEETYDKIKELEQHYRSLNEKYFKKTK